MKTKAAYMTVDKIIQDLAIGYRKPFELNGHTKQGDIFYSDISFTLKTNRIHDPTAFSRICKELQALDYYIHS
jgi:hypothetical protein